LSLDPKVRPVSVDDIPAVARLEKETFGGDAYVEMTLRQFHDIARDLFLVATVDDEVVGYGLVLPSAPGADPCFASIAVAPDWRHGGVGHRLMEEMLDICDGLGFVRISSTVDPANTAAIQLASGLGFAIAERVDNYFGPGKHRLVMVRRNPSSP
jgi:ribosomal-protein-alanine N-acetyltransferase